MWNENSYEARDANENLVCRIKEEQPPQEEEATEGFLRRLLNSFLATMPPVYAMVKESKRSRYVLEGAGGEPKGEIRRRLRGWKYRVYDANQQLTTTIIPRSQIGNANWGIDDAKGKHLANYDRSDFDRDNIAANYYQLVSPTGGIIARIRSDPVSGEFCHIMDVWPQGLDPFLVFCYVAAMDNAYKWMSARSESI